MFRHLDDELDWIGLLDGEYRHRCVHVAVIVVTSCDDTIHWCHKPCVLLQKPGLRAKHAQLLLCVLVGDDSLVVHKFGTVVFRLAHATNVIKFGSAVEFHLLVLHLEPCILDGQFLVLNLDVALTDTGFVEVNDNRSFLHIISHIVVDFLDTIRSVR